jgi:hypothetical protein
MIQINKMKSKCCRRCGQTWSLLNSFGAPLTPVTVEPDLTSYPIIPCSHLHLLRNLINVSLDPITALQIGFQLRTSCVQLIPFKCRRVVVDAYDRAIKAVNVSILNLKCHARFLCFIPYTMSRFTNRSNNQSAQIKSWARSFGAKECLISLILLWKTLRTWNINKKQQVLSLEM